MLIHPTVTVGKNTIISPTAVIEEHCKIGDNCFIGHYTVLRPYTHMGNDCKISHLCVCEGRSVFGNHVHIMPQCHMTLGMMMEDWTFVATMTVFANDKKIKHGRWEQQCSEWGYTPPMVQYGARIGVGCCIMPGVIVGRNSLVGSGSVVVRDVPEGMVVFGNPAIVQRAVPPNEIIHRPGEEVVE